jgi:hypothetical protein
VFHDVNHEGLIYQIDRLSINVLDQELNLVREALVQIEICAVDNRAHAYSNILYELNHGWKLIYGYIRHEILGLAEYLLLPPNRQISFAKYWQPGEPVNERTNSTNLREVSVSELRDIRRKRISGYYSELRQQFVVYVRFGYDAKRGNQETIPPIW